ncbi:MAG: type I-B CRISPR-associated protein Cas7/Cst2/DevR [Armatimonadetes bacterium]|nr:type I-B CRISPR-associated protein Cas7/Cst2/DevR [Armatimonadota bacterium]
MSFITGMMLIEAPASALNNAGAETGQRTDNIVVVKTIKARDGAYPYVSAQAFRYWVRTTAEKKIAGWKAAPIQREAKVAYTDANPLEWWDDDLFGYMRAPGSSKEASASREESSLTDLEAKVTLTRCAPFRVGTFIAVAPCTPTDDFGTMSRHEGNPVPFEHQFYHTHLKGLFSLDLRACGTFSYADRTGFKNLDSIRQKAAEERGLEHLEREKSYRLPIAHRAQRVAALLEAMAALEGGANQTLHYTDVAPAFLIAAVMKGGNHPFARCVKADAKGLPVVNLEALTEALNVFADQLQSPLYIGWAHGYMDDSRAAFEEWVGSDPKPYACEIVLEHPRKVLQRLAADVQEPGNAAWFD